MFWRVRTTVGTRTSRCGTPLAHRSVGWHGRGTAPSCHARAGWRTRYSMARCGTGQPAVAWRGAAWRGAKLHGKAMAQAWMTRPDSGSARHGTARHGMVRHRTAPHRIAWYGTAAKGYNVSVGVQEAWDLICRSGRGIQSRTNEVCSYGVCSYGLFSYGLCSYGTCSYCLFIHGLYGYGLCSCDRSIQSRPSNLAICRHVCACVCARSHACRHVSESVYLERACVWTCVPPSNTRPLFADSLLAIPTKAITI